MSPSSLVFPKREKLTLNAQSLGSANVDECLRGTYVLEEFSLVHITFRDARLVFLPPQSCLITLIPASKADSYLSIGYLVRFLYCTEFKSRLLNQRMSFKAYDGDFHALNLRLRL